MTTVHVLELRLRFFCGLGIVGPHAGALANEAADQGERGCFSHVVGSRLEGEAPEGERFPSGPRRAAESFEQEELILATVPWLDDLALAWRGAKKAISWGSTSAVPDTGKSSGRSGPPAARAPGDVGTTLQTRDLIHEADPLASTRSQHTS
jgi:hypothetical protein